MGQERLRPRLQFGAPPLKLLQLVAGKVPDFGMRVFAQILGLRNLLQQCGELVIELSLRDEFRTLFI